MAETEKMSEIHPTVEFLYKTMLARERDPHKRRVKPVQPHLLQLNFSGLDNSSDDSDFKVDDDESGDDDDEDDDDDDDEDNDDENGEQDGNEIDDDDGRSSGVVSSKQTNNSLSEDDSQPAHQPPGPPPTIDSSLSTKVPVALQPKIISPNKTPSEETPINSVSSKKMKVLICSVCLKDAGQSNDEILECDSCSVLVHEGCYGACDSLSVFSSESSASMEPWFCDACRAGVKPHCELCPNSGGVYKETDAGRWVHLVCALYVPGVAFGDVSKLNNITLFEMSYSKWGARECSLCEDERFSRTGVCISCDAGMCRTYFHVTCAQREGLLMEAAPDEEIADPFYAYCKQHAEKGSMRLLRRNCLALQSYMKNVEIAREKDETGKLRLQQKLHLHQQKYQEIKELGPPGWVPKEKLPRMLLTSANALRQLLKKAELLGHHVQEDRSRDIRKKWHAPPALDIDFVSYFLDRNEHISKMKTAIGELNTQKDKLQIQEKCLHAKYDELSTELSQICATNVELQQCGEKLWNCLCDIYGRRLRIPDCVSFRNAVKSPPKKDSAAKSPTAFIHCCSFCKKTSDQHLLAKCDKCRQFIHLGCLNPPLTRMPKKTKQQGWQCSQCASPNISDGDFPDVDPDQPRQLREKNLIRGPMKYTAQFSEFTTRKDSSRLKKRKDAKSLLRLHKRPQDNGRGEGAEPAAKLLKFSPSKDNDLGAVKCAKCNLEAADDSAVVCGRCQQSYHSGCLHPSQNKSPKVHGTDWRCENCQDEVDAVVKETSRSEEDFDVGGNCRPSDSGPRKFRLLASSAFAAKKDRTLASTRTRRKVSLSRRAMENIAYQQKSTFASGRNGHLGKKKDLKSDRESDGGSERATGDTKPAKLSPSAAVKVSPNTNALQSVENAAKRSPNRSILRSAEKSPTKTSPTKTPPKPAVSDTAKYDTQAVIEISDDDSCQ